MPIRILCPEGCRFVAPTRQAGRQVRCPKCRTVLKLPELPAAPEVPGETLVILKAVRVGDSRPEIEPIRRPADSQASSGGVKPSERAAPRPVENADASIAEAPLVVEPAAPESERSARSDMATSFIPVALAIGPISGTAEAVSALPEIRLDHGRLVAFESRRHQAMYEMTRRSIGRVIAFCVLLLGLTNILIGAWQSGWLTNPATAQLPSWAIVLIFIGALHAAYAALLAQVGDWSGNWVTAIFLLAVAVIAAAATVVLGVARPDHPLIRWLELPRILQLKGAIWSLCMVLMAASLAWWCGREALLWRRTVGRLQESSR